MGGLANPSLAKQTNPNIITIRGGLINQIEMTFSKKIYSFIRRLKKGELRKPFYLAWYYSYLSWYDLINGTKFSISQTAAEGKVPDGGTGNFPAHPKLIKKFIALANLNSRDRILDVGHGSGIVLHVASTLGFKNLTGIEFSDIAFDQSKKNLKGKAYLIHGNALNIDLNGFDVVFFFSPFRGKLAMSFFENVTSALPRVVIAVNSDPIIEPILKKFYQMFHRYQHPLYENFNCKIWMIKDF